MNAEELEDFTPACSLPIAFIMPAAEREYEWRVRRMAIGFDYVHQRYILPTPALPVVDPREYRVGELNIDSSYGSVYQ